MFHGEDESAVFSRREASACMTCKLLIDECLSPALVGFAVATDQADFIKIP
jgi:hypothetical protein